MHKPTARRLIWWCALAACVVALVFAARGLLFRTSPPLTLSGQTMGTAYTIKMVAPPASVDVAALNSQVRQTLDRI